MPLEFRAWLPSGPLLGFNPFSQDLPGCPNVHNILAPSLVIEWERKQVPFRVSLYPTWAIQCFLSVFSFPLWKKEEKKFGGSLKKNIQSTQTRNESVSQTNRQVKWMLSFAFWFHLPSLFTTFIQLLLLPINNQSITSSPSLSIRITFSFSLLSLSPSRYDHILNTHIIND